MENTSSSPSRLSLSELSAMRAPFPSSARAPAAGRRCTAHVRVICSGGTFKQPSAPHRISLQPTPATGDVRSRTCKRIRQVHNRVKSSHHAQIQLLNRRQAKQAPAGNKRTQSATVVTLTLNCLQLQTPWQCLRSHSFIDHRAGPTAATRALGEIKSAGEKTAKSFIQKRKGY